MKKNKKNKNIKKTETKGIIRDNGDRCCTWLFELFKKEDEVKEGGHE